jgi:hypothetical protein
MRLFPDNYLTDVLEYWNLRAEPALSRQTASFEGDFKMFKITPLIATVASIGTIAAVPVLGGLAVFLITGVPQAKAEPKVQVAVHQTQAKADRLSRAFKGTGCSALGWPHYEQTCQFDMRRPADDMRTVRVIALR